MITKTFLVDALERAIKTAAQTAVVAIGAAAGFDLFTANWRSVGGAAAGGFILSVLTSLSSKPFGDAQSASVVSEPWTSISASDFNV